MEIYGHFEDANMEDVSRKFKIVQSLALFSGMLAMGISFSVIGPTLLDLQELTNSDTDEISIVLILRNVGGVMGALLGGPLIPRVNPWVLVSVSEGIFGISQILVPYCSNLLALGVVITTGNIAAMFYDSIGSMQLIKIWRDEHESWMQAYHCLFGVGSLLGPLIATPFLSPTVPEETPDNETSIPMNVTILTDGEETKVKYAYFIAGGILCFCSTMFLLLCMSGEITCFAYDRIKRVQNTRLNALMNSRSFFITFSVLMFFYFWMYCTLEQTSSFYLATYTVDELGWSKTAGASVSSAFWASFTVGRVFSIFIVRRISTELLLFSSTAITILSLIPEVFFAHSHVSIMWISSILFGFFLSPIYAGGLTFANMYVDFSGGIGSVFVAAGAVGALTGPVLIVPLFGTFGMQVFVVLIFVASIIQFFIFTSAAIIGKKHGKRKTLIVTEMHSEESPLLS